MPEDGLLARDTTSAVIGAFFEVYNTLGFGFMEHVYSCALERELVSRGHRVAREVSVTIFYKGDAITSQRLDLLVDDLVVVELKSSEVLPAKARRQTINYLRATTLEVALLLHFGPVPRFYRLIATNVAYAGDPATPPSPATLERRVSADLRESPRIVESARGDPPQFAVTRGAPSRDPGSASPVVPGKARAAEVGHAIDGEHSWG